MSHQQSYRPNVNRAVTRKWAEARHPDYGGDDWGDDGYDSYDDEPPPSAPPQRNPQPWISQERRSFTNPMPQRGPGRSSFDQGDERRYFSTSAGGGFESAYPTAQRPPIPEPQHDDPAIPGYRQQPSLQLNTSAQGPYPSMHHSAGSGNQAYPTHPNAPFSAPIQAGRRSQSGSRPSTDAYGQPLPGSESRESSSSGRQLPPRKSSLGQQQSPDLPMFAQAEGLNQPTQVHGEIEKPLPFIRPADIYKRVEAEREKERRSQDSSRPSIDSATGAVRDHSLGRTDSAKDIPPSSNVPTSAVEDSERKTKPTLDPVPERKSEYGFENILQSAGQSQVTEDQDSMIRHSKSSQTTEKSPHPTVSPISTEVGDSRPAEIPSASSRYTDRVDPTSASTFNSAFPSRMASQQEHSLRDDYNSPSGGLPEISRMSTFGSDIVSGNIKDDPWRDSQETIGLNERGQQSGSSQSPIKTIPTVSERNESSSGVTTELEHKSSFGYRSAVRQAFENEVQTMTSPTTSETLPRSNSASTSEISPIVSRRNDPKTDLPIMENLTSQTIPEEPSEKRVQSPPDLSQPDLMNSRGREEPLEAPPNIRGTSRRDSPSPARRPLSFETPQIPEPAQAVISDESPVSSPHDVRTAEAISVNKLNAGDSARIIPSTALGYGSVDTALPGEKSESLTMPVIATGSVANPALHHQTSQMSEKSSPSLPRTHSEEWREWSDARKEFNARHGIKDSNPPTPGAPSSGRPSPLPQTGFISQISPGHQDGNSTGTNNLGLRPSIPGGWQSYNTLPEVELPSSTNVDEPRPPFASGESRSESAESIPTATAPKTMDWRAQHAGGLNHPYPEAAAAGSALAGIFSGPALTQETPRDSENNSIDEPIYGPTGTNQDSRSAARDFGSVADAPATHSSSAVRDFTTDPNTTQLANVNTQTSANKDIHHETAADDNTPTRAIQSGLNNDFDEDAQSPSPLQSKAEDFPAPLRTSNSSISQEFPRASIPSITTSSAVEDTQDSEKLQEDIVRSLTPKTSHTDDTTTPAATYYSTTPKRDSDQNGDEDVTPRITTSTVDTIHHDNVQSYDNTGSPVHVSQPLSTTGYDQLERGTFHEGSPTVPAGPSNDHNNFATQSVSNERPFLGKRFSFEDDEPAIRDDFPSRNQAGSVSPVVQSPSQVVAGTRASIDKALPSMPMEATNTTNTIVTNPSHVDDHNKQSPTEAVKVESVSKSSPSSPVSIRHPEINIPTTAVQAAAAPSASAHSQLSAPTRSFPVEKVVFRDIMSYSTSRERTQAFNDNRKLFAEPSGQLENWLTSMNTSDHAEAFVMKTPPQQHAPSSPNAGRTPPRRESGAPIGTKQMQEDGKKLLAAAGKYGGKAGSAAKGLFARGKDKLRTVSAGEKVAR